MIIIISFLIWWALAMVNVIKMDLTGSGQTNDYFMVQLHNAKK